MSTLSTQNTVPAHQLGQNLHSASSDHDSTYIPRGDTTLSINYFKPPEDGSKPFNYVEDPPTGLPKRNFGDFDIDVRMHDVRGFEDSYTLDKDAFMVARVSPSAETEFVDDASIKKNYYPEVEQLLLDKVPGATKVILFDHTIRRTAPNAHRAPVSRVHIDQTEYSARKRVYQHTDSEAEAEKLLAGRYRIINIWRPLNGPVQTFPLAFASSSTTRNEDLIPIEHRYPDRIGQTAGVQYNEGQKWHYLSGMTNDERLFLECFDSDALKEGSKVQGGRVPHTAFVDPRSPKGAVGRESIEVRALVFGP